MTHEEMERKKRAILQSLAEGARAAGASGPGNGKRPSVVAEAFLLQVKLDAGTRIGLCRTWVLQPPL